MKICSKCGAPNSDKRLVCIDCGEVLPDRLSVKEERAYRKDLEADMNDAADSFRLSSSDKTAGVTSIIGIIASVVVMIFLKSAFAIFGFGAIFFFAFSAFMALAPRLLWNFKMFTLGFKFDGEPEPNGWYSIGRIIAVWVLIVTGFCVLFMMIQSASLTV